MTREQTNSLASWTTVPFTNCIDEPRIKKPRKIFARDYFEHGRIPIVDQGQEVIAGWTNEESVAIRENLPFIIFGDHTRVFKFVDFPFAMGADGTHLLKPAAAFNPRFFYYACLHLPLPHRGYNRHFTILKEQKLPRPQMPEQEKIATILRKVQRAIEVQEKLVATARELKQSAMRQLFTRGLRNEFQKETDIGPLPESWTVRPLEELREFLQYGTSAKCDYHGKGNPVLRIPNIVDGTVSCDDLKWCELSEKEVESLVLEPGDVVFIRTNGVRRRVGTCSIYRGQPAQALFASYLIRARLKTNELDPDFFQYFSATAVGASLLGGRASPAADGKFNVNTKTIDSVLVPLPSPIEQHEIAEILQTIDRKIVVHERKCAALQELFRTLLDQLMTGRIRVANVDIDVSEIQS